MKKFYLLIPSILLLACSNNLEKDNLEEKHEHSHHHNAKEEDANEHMHKSSFEGLVKRFESAERDEYQKPNKVVAFLGDLEGKKVIDIGAGTGYFSVKLAAKGATVIAADVDDRFLKYIKERINKNKFSGIETRKIPYDAPGLKDNEVDMVLIVNTYHHIRNRTSYFTKVKKGIKENGELIIIDFFKYKTPIGPPVNHKIAMDVVVNELKKAGYTSFDINVDLLPYQYIIKAK